MILEQIVADSTKELEARKAALPLADMKSRALSQPPARDFAAAIGGSGVHLIAEIKKASPSKGIIRPDFKPVEIAHIYASNGAAAISVLTETRHFQGSLNYLKSIRDSLGEKRPPLLRKDFIFDPYQVYESRAYGADALLLITAILTRKQLGDLLELSIKLGMNCLVEVHNEIELDIALNSGAVIIGINNRDLKTFVTDLSTTERLCRLIPARKIIVSESGIKTHGDILKLQRLGVNAVLIGEAFMSSSDINAKMKELM